MDKIYITPGGNILAIETKTVGALLTNEFGCVETRRASHVLPRRAVKRAAFILLRALFGERGTIAEWQRQWRGPWQVSWAEAPAQVVFIHGSRRKCIEWEIKQLNQRLSKN